MVEWCLRPALRPDKPTLLGDPTARSFKPEDLVTEPRAEALVPEPWTEEKRGVCAMPGVALLWALVDFGLKDAEGRAPLDEEAFIAVIGDCVVVRRTPVAARRVEPSRQTPPC